MKGRSRKRIKEIEGISLPYVVGSISASGFTTIQLDGKFQKYKPFDVVRVFNDSNSKVDVLINQRENEKYPVGGKMDSSIDEVSIWTLRIVEKDGSAIASGDITLNLFKSGKESKDMVKDIYRKLSWG